jgi:hypothetical protein
VERSITYVDLSRGYKKSKQTFHDNRKLYCIPNGQAQQTNSDSSNFTSKVNQGCFKRDRTTAQKEPARMSKADRTDVLDNAPLRYAPANELGVVFLFAHLAHKWKIRVDQIRAAFPDCIAYQKVKNGERNLLIEFEYKSSNFIAHKHDRSKCNMIVCWEHDLVKVPPNIEIIELRNEFGLGFHAWIMPINDPYKAELREIRYSDKWSVPRQTHKGDLILFYFTLPDQFISELFVAEDNAKSVKAGWKKGMDFMAPIKKICSLKSPIFYQDLKRHPVISHSHFVRFQMRGRINAIEYWPYLSDMIIKRNPACKSVLSKYIK